MLSTYRRQEGVGFRPALFSSLVILVLSLRREIPCRLWSRWFCGGALVGFLVQLQSPIDFSGTRALSWFSACRLSVVRSEATTQ